MGLEDIYGPIHKGDTDEVEPAIITRDVDAGKIPTAMKDELAEFAICRAHCPECNESSYYWDLPGRITSQDCKSEACSAELYISR